MKRVTCKKINAWIKDEHGASHEYASFGAGVQNLNKRQKAMFKAMSKDEHRHHHNLMKMRADICKK